MSVIKDVILNEEGLRPVLVEFQNSKIKPGEEDNLKSALYKTKDNRTVVGVTNGNMVYGEQINNENELYNNFILVHNRKTGKIRLIQVDCCTVSPLLNKKRDELDTSVRTTDTSVSELNKQFGSKKTKRATEQRERLKMNISTVKEQLEKTVSDIQIDESAVHVSTADENNSLYLPKINREASTLEQVYDIYDLVPKPVLDSLANDAENIINGNAEEYGLTPFTSLNVNQMLESSRQVKSKRIKILLYINYLIKFINTPLKFITKKFLACDRSAEVNSHILDNFSFTTGHVRSRPLLMKDKALCYILVLTAYVMDYEVNIETLSKDLKIGIKKVMDISRMLAFSSSSKNKTTVTLKLPLPAPVTFSSKRKRR